MNESFASEIDSIKAQGLYRSLRRVEPSDETHLFIDGKRFLNLSSNNYLGLSTHPAVKKAAADALARYGAGGTASRLTGGTFNVHVELEEAVARFKGVEQALVFPSGYQANIGAICALAGEGDCLIMDRLNHASLWDAAKLSKARVFVYAHRDMDALEKALRRASGYKRKLIVTDTVFSMDGDIAPLADIAGLAGRHGALSYVDEAHATGIFGEGGRGLCEHFGVEGKIDIIMGTFSKALGSQGAFIGARREFIEYLINKSRSFIYTTALAPSSAAAALAAINVVESEPERRKTLLSNAARLREALRVAGRDTMSSESQIVPVLIGPAEETVKLSRKLFEAGIFAPAIRPPTVPEGQCRIRFSLMSAHTNDDIRFVINSLR